jgi:hypothetical protein
MEGWKELIKIVNKTYINYTYSSGLFERKDGVTKFWMTAINVVLSLGQKPEITAGNKSTYNKKISGFQIVLLFLKSYLYVVVTDPTSVLFPTSFCM